ncbi:hypothetical protein BOO86_08305 [Mycobacterium sp. CBMA 234]|uniref:DUF4383 domain-containing protein n=1 Tax=Mycolicibacterium sp. CBMA 234 TaxID=1918495 RepID=UPI0012DF83B5|nr:DUF4383 domain-containing protein [Mycolicibacterium sp. CBMA 234]MUL64460.1 hypothetical protein [Mycolicibacterium sp. CBMA 234]
MLESIRHRIVAYVVALTASWTQFGVGLIALWFTSNGPAAYLTCTSMLTDPMHACTTQVLGIIPVTVNLCHALCHFVTGVLGLIAALRLRWAVVYAALGAAWYIGWGLLGAFGGMHFRHHLGVDRFGSWVHVVEGIILAGLWLGHRLTTRGAHAPT